MPSRRIQRLIDKESGNTRNPVAWGYARVSHITGFKKNESIPAQRDRIEGYYKHVLQGTGVTLGGIKDDGTNISAYRTPFRVRPAGREILARLKPGDHIIFDKVDRIWRSLEDFVELMKIFEAKDITVHIVSFFGEGPSQSRSKMGQFTLRIFVLLAEMESQIKGQRVKEALLVRRKSGRPTTSTCPPGTKKVRKGDSSHKRIVWDEEAREAMSLLLECRDDKVMSWQETLYVIEPYAKKLIRDKPLSKEEIDNLTDRQLKTRRERWVKVYQYEAAYRFLGIYDVAQIPKLDCIREAANQYREPIFEARAKTAGRKRVQRQHLPPELILTLE